MHSFTHAIVLRLSLLLYFCPQFSHTDITTKPNNNNNDDDNSVHGLKHFYLSHQTNLHFGLIFTKFSSHAYAVHCLVVWYYKWNASWRTLIYSFVTKLYELVCMWDLYVSEISKPFRPPTAFKIYKNITIHSLSSFKSTTTI